jgi:hypothetical protein
MAQLEHWAGGKVEGWAPGYWQAKSCDELARMRRRVQTLADELETKGHLAPFGTGLRGWIERMADGKRDLVQLDYRELYNVIEGLKAFAARRGVRIAA